MSALISSKSPFARDLCIDSRSDALTSEDRPSKFVSPNRACMLIVDLRHVVRLYVSGLAEVSVLVDIFLLYWEVA